MALPCHPRQGRDNADVPAGPGAVLCHLRELFATSPPPLLGQRVQEGSQEPFTSCMGFSLTPKSSASCRALPGTSSSPRGCAQTRLSRPGIETTRCFYLFLSPNTEVLPLPRARHTWEPGASPGSGRICIPGWLREATALPVSRSSHLLTPSGCGKCRLNFLVSSLGRKRAQIPTPLPGRCRTPPLPEALLLVASRISKPALNFFPPAQAGFSRERRGGEFGGRREP